jgi:hypothetical protein
MCVCIDNYASEMYARDVKRARKPYACEECGATIQRGEKYIRHFQIWEGDPGWWRTCRSCDVWGDAFSETTLRVCGCAGWVIGGMWEAIEEFCTEHLDYNPRFDHLVPDEPEVVL